MSYTTSIIKVQRALPFKKFLEVLLYKNSTAKFSMSLDFAPYGTASHRGLFFNFDFLGFTFFFSLFGGLLPYWMMSRQKEKLPAAKPPAIKAPPPTQLELDQERAEGEGMGHNHQRSWEQN